jgi:hypothetical protein
MSNNKQQTPVELFWNQLPEILPFTVDTETAIKLLKAFEQSKKFEKERMIEFGVMLTEEPEDAIEAIYHETYRGGESC